MLALALVSGCSSFPSEWRKASMNSPVSPGITGRWEGTWVSHKNGHHGKLRCLVTELSDGRYHNYYHATFWKIFAASYTIDITAGVTNGVYTFSGEKNLGSMFGGVFSHHGTATVDRLSATFSSSLDNGEFQMGRPSAN